MSKTIESFPEEESGLPKWLWSALFGVVLVAGAVALFWPYIRYSYDDNTTLGYVMRIDRFTEERCLDSGRADFLKVLAVERCEP